MTTAAAAANTKPATPSAPKPANDTKPKGPSMLASVTKGRLERPLRVLLYGQEGLGKSTFAANAPAPIFLASEDGTSQLDIERFREPKSWAEVIEAVDDLTTADHHYKTLVIDTLDWIEPLCWAEVCSTYTEKGKKFSSLAAIPYGRGPEVAADVWRSFIARLERMRLAKNMGVVMLAHHEVKTLKNPAGEDYGRYQMKLDKRASGLLREWSDIVLFGEHETLTDDSSGRAKGVSTGERIIHTEWRAGWDAKNRHNLPEVLPLSWSDLMKAIAENRPADPAKLRGQIDAMLAEVFDEELKTKVRAAVAEAGNDVRKLTTYQHSLAERIRQQQPGD